MWERAKDLPFYAQSIRGLDSRQGTLELAGTGNDSAPRLHAVNALRSYDPLAALRAHRRAGWTGGV